MSCVTRAGHISWGVTLRVGALPGPGGGTTVESRVGVGGGNAVNVASDLVGLDVPAALLGSVSDDEYGHVAVAEPASRGVDRRHAVSVDGGLATIKYIVVNTTGEVFVLDSSGVNEASGATDLPINPPVAVNHLHLTSRPSETTATLAGRAHERDTTVSFDPGRRIGDRGRADAPREVDFAFLNDREAAATLDGAATQRGRDTVVDPVSDMAEALAQTTLILKHNPRDAEIRDGDDRHVHLGYPIDTVNTAGTGDAFASGFTVARLDGTTYERALAAADTCGALTAIEPGARAQLSWRRLDDLIED